MAERSYRQVLGKQLLMLEQLVERIVSTDTLHLDHRLVLQLLRSRRASPTLDRHAPPMASHDSYEGVAGQNLVLLKHFQQPLAPVERLRCTERLWERWTAKGKSSWR